jgi:DNA-binding transcriptional MerR regulator
MSKPVQLQIDMFLQNNEQELVDIQESNPELYYNVFQVLDFINARFGRGEKIPRVVAKKEESKQPEVVTVDSHTGEVSTKSEENLFEVGDIITSLQTGERWIIKKVSSDNVDVVKVPNGEEGTVRIKSIKRFIEKKIWKISKPSADSPSIAQPEEILFEVGDVFVSNLNGEGYQILMVSKNDAQVRSIKRGQETNMPIKDINDLIRNEIWEKSQFGAAPTAQPDLPAAGSATTEPEAVMTIQELKDAISGLKLIADFDEEAAQELKRLQNELKQLKKKKA